MDGSTRRRALRHTPEPLVARPVDAARREPLDGRPCTRGRLYVHGGYAGRGLSEPTAALLEYDPRRNRWRRLRSSPTARAAHAAAVVGHRLYVAGGADASHSLRSLEVFRLPHAGAGAGGRASRRRRATTRPAWPPAGASTCSPAGTRRTSRRPSATTRAGGAGSGCRPALRARGDRLGARVRRPDRGVRRREPGAGRHDHRPGGAVRHPQAALAAAARHAHAASRAGRGGARRPRLRGQGGPQPGFHFSRAIEFLDVR